MVAGPIPSEKVAVTFEDSATPARRASGEPEATVGAVAAAR
jgi:hypothetical protein